MSRSGDFTGSDLSPFGGPERVVRYLARYTHRVAISNHRLLRMERRQVTFRWRDSARSGRRRIVTLEDTEFLRRFLLHVLPKGFPKIPRYVLLANRSRKLARCRELLACPELAEADRGALDRDHASRSLPQVRKCVACGRPRVHRRTLPRLPEERPPAGIDSS
jgi:hypothetical protein